MIKTVSDTVTKTVSDTVTKTEIFFSRSRKREGLEDMELH